MAFNETAGAILSGNRTSRIRETKLLTAILKRKMRTDVMNAQVHESENALKQRSVKGGMMQVHNGLTMVKNVRSYGVVERKLNPKPSKHESGSSRTQLGEVERQISSQKWSPCLLCAVAVSLRMFFRPAKIGYCYPILSTVSSLCLMTPDHQKQFY
jgi:hypothetical protein